jgi:hypothetical protein
VRILSSLLFVVGLYAQGTAIPLQTWTLLPAAGWPIYSVGFERGSFSPAADCTLFIGTYHFANSEPNQGFACFSFTEQRWKILHDGSMFHSSYQNTSGHTVGMIGWMPLYASWWIFLGNSGSGVPERPGHTFWFDGVGIASRDKYTGVSPHYIPSNAGVTLDTAAYDQFHGLMIIFPNIVSTLTTYDPSTNLYSQPATSGTAPNPASGFYSCAYNSVDHKVYFYGGVDTHVFSFDAGSNTWARLTPTDDMTHGHPVAREEEGWAYDQDDNIFLMSSGTTDGNPASSLQDTWAYHPDTNAWEWLGSTAPYYDTVGVPNRPFEDMAYDSNNKAFVMFTKAKSGQTNQCTDGNSACVATYAYCYAPCLNAGRVSNTYVPTAGYLNSLYTGSTALPGGQIEESSAGYTSLAVDGSNNLYAAWIENGASASINDVALPHPYVAKSTDGGATWGYLGGAWNSLDGASTQSGNPSIAVVGTTPCLSWWNTSLTPVVPELQFGCWGGSSWSSTTIAARHSASATYYRGLNAVTTIGTSVYIASIESSEAFTDAYIEVDACTVALSCSVVGGSLNFATTNFSTGNPLSRALAVAIASDGTNPYVCWVEESVDASTTQFPITRVPQVYCSHWTGSAWALITAGSLNRNTANWAQSELGVTYFGGHLYVAWNERTTAGNPILYALQCTTSACTTIGSNLQKEQSGNGWPVHPTMTNDGANAILCWEEQANLAQHQRGYCQQWNGSAWSNLGANFNADAVNGSVFYSSGAVANGKPTLLWTEVTPGNLRQVYMASYVASTGLWGRTGTTSPQIPRSVGSGSLIRNGAMPH